MGHQLHCNTRNSNIKFLNNVSSAARVQPWRGESVASMCELPHQLNYFMAFVLGIFLDKHITLWH